MNKFTLGLLNLMDEHPYYYSIGLIVGWEVLHFVGRLIF